MTTKAITEAGTISGFFHAGLTVSDMERSLTFYRDALGLEILVDRVSIDAYLREVTGVESQAIRIVYLRIPGSDRPLELLEHRGVRRKRVSGRPCDPGILHICFYVSSLAAIFRRLAAAGYKFISPPVDITAGPNRGARSCIVLDPDGILVELFQKPI